MTPLYQNFAFHFGFIECVLWSKTCLWFPDCFYGWILLNTYCDMIIELILRIYQQAFCGGLLLSGRVLPSYHLPALSENSQS